MAQTSHSQLVPGHRHAMPIAMAVIAVAATTLVLLGIARLLALREVSLAYLIPVLIVASQWGTLPAVFTALISAAATAYFFYAPIGFSVADPQQVLDLSLFIFVAVVTSQMANNAKVQAELARRREDETRSLYALTRRLSAAQQADEICEAVQQHLRATVGHRIVTIGGARSANADPTALPDPVRDQAETTSSESTHREPDTLVDDGDGRLWLVRPVSPGRPPLGVIVIELGTRSREAAQEMRERIDTVLMEASATLDRLDLVQASNAARMRAEAEHLRDALMGSVSHELRTPLASILGAATTLCEAPPITSDRRLESLAQVIRDEAERLNDEVQMLLDSTRISSEGVRPKPIWVDPADLINAAMLRRRHRLAEHALATEVDHDLPMIHVDPTMVTQAIGQLLDNAAKYSPAGSSILVRAERRDAEIRLAVTDQGVGLDGDEADRLWQRFYRGQRHADRVTGTGLGLWIADAFVTANGGRIAAESRGPDQGTTITITFPVHETHADDSAAADQ